MTAPNIDVARRRVWLRSLRQFKQSVKIRAKLGVVQSLAKTVAAQRKSGPWQAPLWTHPRWLDVLYTSIRDNTCSTELLTGFVLTAEVTFLTPGWQPTVESVLSAVDQVCRQNSRELRKRFGVFVDERQQETTQEIQT